MSAVFYLSPGNDFLATFFLEAPDPTTFAKVPVTSGAISGFVAITNGPTATAAHANLVATITHVGVAIPAADQYPLGTWSVTIDGAGLTQAILDPLFGASGGGATPYLIVDRTGDVRRYQKLKYAVQLAVANG
jgi:hypothetical protein